MIIVLLLIGECDDCVASVVGSEGVMKIGTETDSVCEEEGGCDCVCCCWCCCCNGDEHERERGREGGGEDKRFDFPTLKVTGAKVIEFDCDKLGTVIEDELMPY